MVSRMPSKNQVQELHLSKFSESRKKHHGFPPMENSAASLEYKSQSNSRNSLGWDRAFFTSPGILDPEELFGTLNYRETKRRVEIPGMVASKTFEQERTSRDSEFDSRRSLAWDSAFFTSAGVLDPVELSIVNKGFKGFGNDRNSGMEEKFGRFWGSDCAINRDGYSLASLEIDLFDDLKASNAATSGSKQGRGNNLQNTHSFKTSEASSRVRMKSTPASGRQNTNTNRLERIGKYAASRPPRAWCTSLKQSKILDRATSPSTAIDKRVSSYSKHIKGSHTDRNESTGRSSGLSKSAGKSPLTLSPIRYSPENTPKFLSTSLHSPLLSSPMLQESSASSTSVNQTSDNSVDRLGNIRGSGLRIPSPKLGFFDPVNGNQNEAANGTTHGKLRSRTGNPKLGSPLDIRSSYPGIIQNRNIIKREPVKGNGDSDEDSENTLQLLHGDDKENLCKHMKAIDLKRDSVMEMNKDKSTSSQFRFGNKKPRKHCALVSLSFSQVKSFKEK